MARGVFIAVGCLALMAGCTVKLPNPEVERDPGTRPTVPSSAVRCGLLPRAAARGEVDVVRELTSICRSAAGEVKVERAVVLAARNLHGAAVRTLATEGADLNALSDRGTSAVYGIVTPTSDSGADREAERLATLRVFVDSGGALEVQADDGLTVLQSATASCFPRITDFILVEAPELVDSFGYRGETSLMTAAKLGHVQCVKALLRGGADPALPNRNGKTAAHLARRNGFPRIARLLYQSERSSQRTHG